MRAEIARIARSCGLVLIVTYAQIADKGWLPPDTAPHDCEILVMWNEGTIGATHWIDAVHPDYKEQYLIAFGMEGWALGKESIYWTPLPTDISGWYPLGPCGVPTS